MKEEDEATGDDQKALHETSTKIKDLSFLRETWSHRRDCWKLAELQAVKEAEKKGNKHKHIANKVTIKQRDREMSSDSDKEALVVSYALAATSKKLWIVDSGAIVHV